VQKRRERGEGERRRRAARSTLLSNRFTRGTFERSSFWSHKSSSLDRRNTRGYLWIFMDIYGYLWIFVDICGYLCTGLLFMYAHTFVHTWRYWYSLMKPVNGAAHPSAKICSHCTSSSVIFTLGRVPASAFADASLESGTKSSLIRSEDFSSCGMMRYFFRSSITVDADSSRMQFSVLTTKSGFVGLSYIWSMPVKPLIAPSRAFL